LAHVVYLDHNATTPLRPGVAEAVAKAMALGGNASSVHRHGRLARRAVDEARSRVAALVGASPDEVVFTSGGSEANDLAINGGDRRRVLVSAVEHASVLDAAPDGERLAVDTDGVVDVAALESRLAADDAPALVSVMFANNETGVRQPVSEIVDVAHRHGALVHCDAVQAAGHIAIDMAALGLDLLTLSAHKMGGPQGVGALVLAPGVAITPRLRGGGQERGRRAGTENLPGIAGFGAAAEAIDSAIDQGGDLANLRDALESRIKALAPGSSVLGAGASRLNNTSCITMPGVAAETQVVALDLAGFAVSAGAACSSGKVGPSHVLAAMGVDVETASTAIRVSLGANNDINEVERFVAAWRALYVRAGRHHILSAPAA
jgi:cysteine desulfurase